MTQVSQEAFLGKKKSRSRQLLSRENIFVNVSYC